MLHLVLPGGGNGLIYPDDNGLLDEDDEDEEDDARNAPAAGHINVNNDIASGVAPGRMSMTLLLLCLRMQQQTGFLPL